MKINKKHCLAMLFPLLLSSAFTQASEHELPIKQVTEQSQQGKLIWADLYTGDVKASLNFYTETFGWTVKKFGKKSTRYHLLYDDKQPIAGVLERSAQRNKTETALWIGSIATDDVQTRVIKATDNSATIILKPHDFTLYGKRAVIADPQGGVIALLDLDEENSSHQSISKKRDWAQLFSVDTTKAASFYQNTFKYDVEEVAQNQSSYYLSLQDEIRASIVKLPLSFEQRDRWVNFVEVAHLAKVLAKAKENGAKIIYQPKNAQLAIIADPNGALLGLSEQEAE